MAIITGHFPWPTSLAFITGLHHWPLAPRHHPSGWPPYFSPSLKGSEASPSPPPPGPSVPGQGHGGGGRGGGGGGGLALESRDPAILDRTAIIAGII